MSLVSITVGTWEKDKFVRGKKTEYDSCGLPKLVQEGTFDQYCFKSGKAGWVTKYDEDGREVRREVGDE